MKILEKTKIFKLLRNKITSEFDIYKDEGRKIGAEKYMKNVLPSIGLSNPQVKKVFSTIKSVNEYKNLNFNDKYAFALEYLQKKHIEEKLISIHILNNIYKSLDYNHIDEIKDLVKKGYVEEWATCDGICIYILKQWSTLSKENTIHIANFCFDKDNIWVRRMSCVTFIIRVKHKDKGNFPGFINLMFDICEENIKYNYRFNQLGTGWLLRELSLVDYKRFYNFIIDNFDKFIREGLRYAVEKLDETKKKKIMSFRSDNIGELGIKKKITNMSDVGDSDDDKSDAGVDDVIDIDKKVKRSVKIKESKDIVESEGEKREVDGNGDIFIGNNEDEGNLYKKSKKELRSRSGDSKIKESENNETKIKETKSKESTSRSKSSTNSTVNISKKK